jgi:hypothetical protein
MTIYFLPKPTVEYTDPCFHHVIYIWFQGPNVSTFATNMSRGPEVGTNSLSEPWFLYTMLRYIDLALLIE